MLKSNYAVIRTKLRKLSNSQLAGIARELDMPAEIHDMPDLIVDLAAENIGDVPELARLIPE